MAGHLINEFSLFSYVAPGRAMGTWAITAVGVTSKVVTVKGITVASTHISGSPAVGAKIGGIAGKSMGVVFGSFGPAFATSAEVSATLQCGCGYLD